MMETLADSFARRHAPAARLADEAERVAQICRDLAEHFQRGGRLIVFGNGSTATDAHHIVVEFVHPVIVGKRALPAMALTNDPAAVTGIARAQGFDEVFAAQLRLLAQPADIALGLSTDGNCANVLRGLRTARERGLLTIALLGGDGGQIARFGDAEHILVIPTDDACVAKEVFVTTYHILWELVQVLCEQPGVPQPAVGG